MTTELDLTNAYYLNLSAVGCKSHSIRVTDSENAVFVFCDYRDHNGLGASDMKRDCGKVTDSKGSLVATICYNGRVKRADGSFLDGLTGTEWVARSVA